MVKFKQCFEDIEGLEYTNALVVDVPTRWNSCYAMLASAIPYKKLVLMNSLNYKDEVIRTSGEQIFKINTLVHCYGEIDPVGAKDKVDFVKNKLYKLFEFYDRNSSIVAVDASQDSSVIPQVVSSSRRTAPIRLIKMKNAKHKLLQMEMIILSELRWFK
ncbi:hypothetical protein PIB30_009742 [Stylosanthes scabra]|uniref:Uncharacterized protein n=1 Tax=Stylosanthes scabra TaxID=79078 RepID=A0ABU6W3X9_9FABA|nr:hypothetical protein [Stylosanthes scabra]